MSAEAGTATEATGTDVEAARTAEGAGLPAVRTPLTPEEILSRLDQASRRGRLPGFVRGGHGGLFAAAAFGQPFDKVLVATATPAPGGGTALAFRTKLLPKMPAVFAVILALTVWPGVRIMDQLIPASWGWIPTWWWYIPLTVLPIPFAWRAAMRKSNASAAESARSAIDQIAQETGGSVAGPDQATPR